MDDLELHSIAQGSFAAVLGDVREEHWGLATPASDWDVAALIAHVVGGERMATALLDGGSVDDARAAITAPLEPSEALTAFASACEDSKQRFAAPGALERVVHHPMGDFPGAQLLGFRIADLTLHGWDLSRAIGTDDTINPDLVAAVWSQLEPLSPFIDQIGVFGMGPSGEVPDDADLQRRLLDLSGRRP